LLVGNKYYDTKIDIWSAGVVFLKLLLKFMNRRVGLFEAKCTDHLCKIISETIGDPTEEELFEMMGTNN